MVKRHCSRRRFLKHASAGALSLSLWNHRNCFGAPAETNSSDAAKRIADAEIRAGVEAAIQKNILPAAVQTAYPGHFQITADGSSYGGDATWPGLDSWQMAGAFLLLGRTQIVLDYFDFVRASQRKNGDIPFAIFPEQKPNTTCLRNLKWPDDVFTNKPPQRADLPKSSQQTRKWIGMFEHWQNIGDPLTTLGPVCYILTAAEIYDATKSSDWLKERIPSVEAAAEHLVSRKAKNGLVSGSGFYTEQPPRNEWDGVTQCYVVHAFRELARVSDAIGNSSQAGRWAREASVLAKDFSEQFWRGDHFGEYIHPEHGLVDSHGYSDVNWAAIAFGITSPERTSVVIPQIIGDSGFWWGDMPTQTVTKPFTYEGWELNNSPPCPDPPLNDVAAMGRVWYLEAMAYKRMQMYPRLIESVKKVCRAAKSDGFWRERYHPQKDGTVKAEGAQKYCEYPAVLVRVVLGMPEVFEG